MRGKEILNVMARAVPLHAHTYRIEGNQFEKIEEIGHSGYPSVSHTLFTFKLKN